MIRIYSTLSRKKEELQPIEPRRLHLFVCGPTVYDYSHIGHARTYIVFDIIVKYLRKEGFEVVYLQNITDMDDKIIQRAAERGEEPLKLARRFEQEYHKDMESLGVDSVNIYARATNHIPEIVDQVKRLFNGGYAYTIEGDGIYYDISKFQGYGKLSHRTVGQAEDATTRIDESINKHNRGDFALWKFVSEQEKQQGIPAWDSPWGPGRPGWHIEDTAITEKFFGFQYDIHGGARDLIFPHHEAEISQMEAISEKEPLARYWMHTGFLTVNGEKMSKSLGNFITIRDFLKVNSPRLLRLLVAKSHYSSPIDYSDTPLKQLKKELEKIDEFVARLEGIETENLSTKEADGLITAAELGVKGAMEEDFNTAILIAVLFELVREGNILLDAQKINKDDAKRILSFLGDMDKFFSFIFWGKEEIEVPEEIEKLAEQREQYRKAEDWGRADELRKKLEQEGWTVQDISSGWKLKKLVYQK